ncbi:MAG: preprotein translocase subunit SecG [Planctomycetales bacterium]|nr:preprotein translocase subunit SecG [Planctomycetales bacterium]
MRALFLVLYVFVCVFLILVVLLRRGEGGGAMGGVFGGFGAESPFGVKTVQTLDRIIAWTFGILVLLALAIATVDRWAAG